ncbi:MAG TPA: hypothetical protein DEO70_12250 [Bacteroidales bacterium]|nr:MAG: hypothetical protein A2X11_10245 [Bacteroidetes bacterium GWE2_42_24]OFY25891.1 MAG: hypothetical protein A2X09_09620 [Bacteroidetes bacterium GWF2_43_11]HBZ67600.1 hypothetical protein [Bacteroidales bacterium]
MKTKAILKTKADTLNLFRFILNVLSTGTPESSKRVFGAIMIIWVHVLMSCQVYHPVMETSLYLGAALLGLETLRDVFRKPVSNNEYDPNNNQS